MVVIDALWYDRIGASGYSPAPGVFIDSLFEKSVLATNFYASGCPTQFVFPSIFTSTLPLDNCGYGAGIRDRGKSFVEILKNAGYATAGFVTAGWCSRLYGYDRGFDTYHEFFDFSLFVRILRDYQIGFYADLVLQEKMARTGFFEKIGPVLEAAFPALARFCLDKLKETVRGGVLVSPTIHSWDFKNVIDLVKSEQMKFSQSPETYMENLIPAWKTHPLFGTMADAPDGPLSSSGAYVIEQVKRWLENPRSAPFFVWAHLMDVHESRYSTFDFVQSTENLKQESDCVAEMNARIDQKGDAYRSNKKHDCALAYTDEQVKRLHAFLAEKGLLKDTIFVLTSDHGSRTAGFPRPDFKDISAFYDQLYHVPFAIIHESFQPSRLDQLCSSMDLAPTILDMAGLPAPEEYRGAPVYSPKTHLRNHLIMEHVGRGPCDMEIKPINICVRTRQEKGVFISAPGLFEKSTVLSEAYDLVSDRYEQKNLADAGSQEPRFERLQEIATGRLSEIRTSVQKTSPGL